MLIQAPVLVLNQNYQPLNVCNVRRALVLLDREKAELMENGRGLIHSVSRPFPVPSVIRLQHMVKRPMVRRRLSRRGVFARDRNTCQYCGKESRSMTLDHIKPRSKGGKHVWDNVVSACKRCNHKKAGRTPSEASMELMRKPMAPKPNTFYMFEQRRVLAEWRPFIPWVDA
jgi:5-methylcytosine-specific restriction endonuclease McrA